MLQFLSAFSPSTVVDFAKPFQIKAYILRSLTFAKGNIAVFVWITQNNIYCYPELTADEILLEEFARFFRRCSFPFKITIAKHLLNLKEKTGYSSGAQLREYNQFNASKWARLMDIASTAWHFHIPHARKVALLCKFCKSSHRILGGSYVAEEGVAKWVKLAPPKTHHNTVIHNLYTITLYSTRFLQMNIILILSNQQILDIRSTLLIHLQSHFHSYVIDESMYTVITRWDN